MKPVVRYNSKGESGNIFYLLGLVSRVLGTTKVTELFNQIKEEERDYKQALELISEYVKLIDDPSVK